MYLGIYLYPNKVFADKLLSACKVLYQPSSLTVINKSLIIYYHIILNCSWVESDMNDDHNCHSTNSTLITSICVFKGLALAGHVRVRISRRTNLLINYILLSDTQFFNRNNDNNRKGVIGQCFFALFSYALNTMHAYSSRIRKKTMSAPITITLLVGSFY